MKMVEQIEQLIIENNPGKRMEIVGKIVQQLNQFQQDLQQLKDDASGFGNRVIIQEIIELFQKRMNYI